MPPKSNARGKVSFPVNFNQRIHPVNASSKSSTSRAGRPARFFRLRGSRLLYPGLLRYGHRPAAPAGGRLGRGGGSPAAVPLRDPESSLLHSDRLPGIACAKRRMRLRTLQHCMRPSDGPHGQRTDNPSAPLSGGVFENLLGVQPLSADSTFVRGANLCNGFKWSPRKFDFY